MSKIKVTRKAVAYRFPEQIVDDIRAIAEIEHLSITSVATMFLREGIRKWKKEESEFAVELKPKTPFGNKTHD